MRMVGFYFDRKTVFFTSLSKFWTSRVRSTSINERFELVPCDSLLSCLVLAWTCSFRFDAVPLRTTAFLFPFFRFRWHFSHLWLFLPFTNERNRTYDILKTPIWTRLNNQNDFEILIWMFKKIYFTVEHDGAIFRVQLHLQYRKLGGSWGGGGLRC